MSGVGLGSEWWIGVELVCVCGLEVGTDGTGGAFEAVGCCGGAGRGGVLLGAGWGLFFCGKKNKMEELVCWG